MHFSIKTNEQQIIIYYINTDTLGKFICLPDEISSFRKLDIIYK